MKRKITYTGNLLIKIIAGITTIVFSIYGILLLVDLITTDLKAFASYDLLKYRPNIEEQEPPYLDELVEINEDTAAWLTIYNTNIDYPVMQGETDDEYINKNVYGEYAISGSIFMSSGNAKDFSDPYNIIYGHHMQNGSMFGDIMKFKDEKFFDANKKGVLIMQEKVYDLKIMSCIETSAYNDTVYLINNKDLPSFVEYCRTEGKYFRDAKYEKILVLSTCNSATTAGRTVLVCAMTTRKRPLPDKEYGKPTPHRTAIGHPMAGAYWAILNLLILIADIYCIVKCLLLSRKKRMKGRYLAAMIGSGLVSIVLFFLTENIRKPVQMVDAWTLPMLLLLVVTFVVMRLGVV